MKNFLLIITLPFALTFNYVKAQIYTSVPGPSSQSTSTITENVGINTPGPLNTLDITSADNCSIGLNSANNRASQGIKLGATGNILRTNSGPKGFLNKSILQINNGNEVMEIGGGSTIYFGSLNDDPFPGDFNFTGGLAKMYNLLVTSSYSEKIPTGYNFAISDKSYFKSFVSIGDPCIPIDPKIMLAVKGKIYAEQVKIKLIGTKCWSDYVFDKDYKLNSLNAVEKYIKENKHLPEVPSEKEIKENGLEVSEILKIQMQKIEELTLYMIELKKENDQIKKEIITLKSK